MNVYTHDRIDLLNGLLANTTLLYGANALQTVNITRNTPKNPQSAVGYLGIVDYTRGVVTSDVTLDTILVEKTDPLKLAAANSSVNVLGGTAVNLATEAYALTSTAMSFAAGTPATVNYGWITAGLASYLKTKAQPSVSDGTQFAMCIGDEGNGLLLIATWSGTAPTTSTVPTLDVNGNLTSVSDYGLPVGVQRVNMNANINRDQVLDMRSTRPATFVTTYPIDCAMDMEVYQLPGTTDPTVTVPAWKQLTSLSVVSAADPTKVYAKIAGLQKQTEGESIAVGRYLSYTVNFRGTDLQIPIEHT